MTSKRKRTRKYWRRHRKLLKQCANINLDKEISVPRPFVTLSIAGKEIKGLLDTGASVSILGKGCVELLESANLKYRQVQGAGVTTADGSKNPIIGYITLLVTYNNMTKPIQFFLVPSLDSDLFLGVDFWARFGIAPHIIPCISELIYSNPNKHVLSPQQQLELDQIIDSFPSFHIQGLGKTNLLEHHIDVGNSSPIKQKYYPVSPAIQDQLNEKIDDMLKNGIIEESNSSWSSPVVLIRKPNGKSRLCLDSRKVNQVTKKDAYPLPHIDGLLGRLKNTKYITSLDLKDAFWQIPLAEQSRDKTAFTVPGRPLYQFRVMPFGLCNAPQTMCRLMHRVIPNQYHDRIFVYLDDLLIVSETFEEHVNLLKMVAKLLKSANLTINIEKSHFALRETKYLGFLVGEDGLRVDPEKVTAINNFPVPISVKQVRRFLGVAGWYRRFIPNFSSITTPISDLLKKQNVKFHWSQEAQEAFEKLKLLMSSAPVLANPDYSKHFFIRCDASNLGLGSVLYQLSEEGDECPIAFLSQKLNQAQKNYCTTELECLAALVSVQKFRPYIEGHAFTIITDHASLKWLMNQKDLNGRLARWSLKLQAFDFNIQHVKGVENVVPDALSRVYTETLDEMLHYFPLIVNVVDLEHDAFNDVDYVNFRTKIESDPAKFWAFRVHENRIYIRLDPKPNDLLSDLSIYKLWVPQPLREMIMSENHDDPIASHCGFRKTIERIKKIYYWPRMVAEVKAFVANCDLCKEIKPSNQVLRPPMATAYVADRPFQKIFVDLLGPYPRSSNNKTVILVVLDQLTKFVLLKTFPKANASKIIDYLKNEIFHVYGVAEVVHTDNGSQFVSREFQSLLSEFGIRHFKTAVYSPQSNASERVNRSILSAIRAYVKSKHTLWDKFLPEIGNALRNCHHESIGVTPHFALFGYHKIHHGDTYKLLREIKSVGEGEMNLELPHHTRLSLIHSDIQNELKKAYEKGSKVYNLRSRPIEFSPGQKVFVRLHPLSDATKKFSAKFSPKFKKAFVLERSGKVNYVLSDEKGNKLGTFHAKDIKL